MRVKRKHPWIHGLLLLLHSSPYPGHETPWFIYVLSFILVERFCHRWHGYGSARGSRISFSKGEKDLSRWHAITILNILQTVDLVKWYRDRSLKYPFSIFFRRKEEFVTWKLYCLYFYWSFVIRKGYGIIMRNEIW